TGPSPPAPPGPLPPPSPPPLPGPVSRTHTVQRGENLSVISQKYYGTQSKWAVIYAANKAVIGSNPNLIKPGQVLTIPP
ncbi:MAG: LysM peptidoglycan-binding domain-containing protein, partial [Hyphomicrobiales bacterium]